MCGCNVLVTCLFTVLYMGCVKVTRSAWVGKMGGVAKLCATRRNVFADFMKK